MKLAECDKTWEKFIEFVIVCICFTSEEVFDLDSVSRVCSDDMGGIIYEHCSFEVELKRVEILDDVLPVEGTLRSREEMVEFDYIVCVDVCEDFLCILACASCEDVEIEVLSTSCEEPS